MFPNPGTSWTDLSARRPRVSHERPALTETYSVPFSRSNKLLLVLRDAARMTLAGLTLLIGAVPASAQSPTFAGNAQHTANYPVPAQHLNAVRWSTSIDLDNSGAFAHYGAPLITLSNTVIVPVKTTAGFEIKGFDGATGRLKYTLTNDYIPPTLPTNSWFPVYQPVIATSDSGARLYYAGPGGTTYYVANPNADNPGTPVQQCFYTNLDGYASNATAYNDAIVINTPLTADANGVVFFGFRVQGSAPAPLETTNSGFARIDPSGAAAYVLAGPAAGDSAIFRDSHNCAPTLSNDGATLYVAVKSSSANYAYLLGLNSTTLATKYKVLLRDPRNRNFAGLLDNGTASPMVGPDGDVYFGVFANPNNGSRGFLLHFSADLATQKIPSAFGWDYTPAIVPTNMVPSYTGTSPYLLFSKYNNYAGEGDGNGINRIALLDPNASQTDPHSSAPDLREMREVLTVIGPTPDAEYYGASHPYAVREWCINTAALNPATRSVFTPSEDGRVYRWDLAANSLTEAYVLGSGVGEPYVPTVIGPDGMIYAMNGGTLFALGSYTNIAINIYSSAPDLRTVIAGQAITFTAVVTNLDSTGLQPTGTVNFQFITYNGLTATTNFSGGQPLVSGAAAINFSGPSAGSNYLGNYFVVARYSGDANFPPGSAMLIQKFHRSGTSTLLNSGANSNNDVTFTASVASNPPGPDTPTGMVSFWDHTNFLAQVPLNTNGVAAITITNFSSGSHSISATYASDTVFASSSARVVPTPPNVTAVTLLTNGGLQLSFSNTVGAPFTILASEDIALPVSDWPIAGTAIEMSPGQFQFTDALVANHPQQFYRVRSP